MVNGNYISGVLPLAVIFTCQTLPVSAETEMEREIKGVDNRYAIASEHFGDGKVQMHTRSDANGGSIHQIYSFSCVDETFELIFEGDSAPENFPVDDHVHAGDAFEREAPVASLAAHTCEEHDYPLLGWEW